MKLIIETDLGRDPDDFFAICYFVAAGVDIKAITISPGDKDQVAIAKFLCAELGLQIPVGSAKPERKKSSSGGMHMALLEKYGFPVTAEPDGKGCDIIADATQRDTCELFVCGPLQSVGDYLSRNPTLKFPRATMQGGFVGYDVYPWLPRLKKPAKFEGLTTCPTFNLNGDVRGAEKFLASETPRSFVGKNVCHTIVYNRGFYERHCKVSVGLDGTGDSRRARARGLFLEAMGMYLEKHGEKMFHDPAAAVCHLHPDIATWVRGRLFRAKGGWGTVAVSPLDAADQMCVDIDRDRLWKHIFECN